MPKRMMSWNDGFMMLRLKALAGNGVWVSHGNIVAPGCFASVGSRLKRPGATMFPWLTHTPFPANPELTRHLGGCTIGHEGDGRDLVERPLPRVLRLAGRRVGSDGEHGRHRRVGEVDLAHVGVARWLFGEVVRHVGRPSVARDGDGA